MQRKLREVAFKVGTMPAMSSFNGGTCPMVRFAEELAMCQRSSSFATGPLRKGSVPQVEGKSPIDPDRNQHSETLSDGPEFPARILGRGSTLDAPVSTSNNQDQRL